jgi:hypothetical protein
LFGAVIFLWCYHHLRATKRCVDRWDQSCDPSPPRSRSNHNSLTRTPTQPPSLPRCLLLAHAVALTHASLPAVKPLAVCTVVLAHPRSTTDGSPRRPFSGLAEKENDPRRRPPRLRPYSRPCFAPIAHPRADPAPCTLVPIRLLDLVPLLHLLLPRSLRRERSGYLWL